MSTINQARVTDIAERFSAMNRDCGREKIGVQVFFSSGQRIVVCAKSMLRRTNQLGAIAGKPGGNRMRLPIPQRFRQGVIERLLSVALSNEPQSSRKPAAVTAASNVVPS